MASIGQAEAARLSGKNPSTIHWAMKSGKLSYTSSNKLAAAGLEYPRRLSGVVLKPGAPPDWPPSRGTSRDDRLSTTAGNMPEIVAAVPPARPPARAWRQRKP